MKLQHFLLLLLFLCQGSGLRAQTSIFDALTKPEQGKGTVTILQPQAVRALVDSHASRAKTETDGEKSFVTAPGYTIQIFAGNNQRRSKDEAFSKKKQIDKIYSGTPTYVDYTAPFWRLRVGDFQTYEEALCMMYKLTASFPSFRKEMKIVQEKVRIFMN
ncbi:MAG: SPOR domain-containing protein [Tannerella sp.]|jgi:septal ring-binding cell division protein DamX|nr:SPOR domain-containing protein [Tannerella sp.]